MLTQALALKTLASFLETSIVTNMNYLKFSFDLVLLSLVNKIKSSVSFPTLTGDITGSTQSHDLYIAILELTVWLKSLFCNSLSTLSVIQISRCDMSENYIVAYCDFR